MTLYNHRVMKKSHTVWHTRKWIDIKNQDINNLEISPSSSWMMNLKNILMEINFRFCTHPLSTNKSSKICPCIMLCGCFNGTTSCHTSSHSYLISKREDNMWIPVSFKKSCKATRQHQKVRQCSDKKVYKCMCCIQIVIK